MKRLPLQDLIVSKPRPVTTLSLVPAFRDMAAETVESYIFTETIRHHVETILETASRGIGQGFWVQAEYGAGKTHFLATLAALLADTTGELWDKVSDPKIRLFKARFQNSRLFPVVVSLRGESQADALTGQSLFDVVLEKGFRLSLEHTGLAGIVQLSAADDLLSWLDQQAPATIRDDVGRFAQTRVGRSFDVYRQQEGSDAAARLISEYCEKHAIKPQIASSIKSRLAHIYHQITNSGGSRYNGLLVVIDEYEGWEKNRTNPQASSQDAEFLETLAYLLPKDLGLQVFTIVASQSASPAKLVGGHAGDRYINIPLLADRNARDYDMIVSRRVRGLLDDRLPEIIDHYHYYVNHFDFAKGLTEAEFSDIFPFQPRCFEVVRHVTARDLPTARSGISIFYEVVTNPELLKRETLIRVCDLLNSEHLVSDCLLTPVYKDAYNAYRNAQEALPTLDLDPADMPLARDILATLFLWYLSYMERPRGMSLRDIAQATLTVDDSMKADDTVLYVLTQLQPLQQVNFDGKNASFEPKGTDGVSVVGLFNEFRRRVSADRYQVIKTWSDSLFLTTQETRGMPGLFNEFKPGDTTPRRVNHRNLEYNGEIIVADRWQPDWGWLLQKEDTHFRLVILTPDAAENPKASDLLDPRIAVIHPDAISEEALLAASNWRAWTQMNEDFKNETGKQAEAVREWLVTQRPTILNALIQTHLSLYRSGRIITRDDLGINAREAFGLASNEQRFTGIVDKVLTAAYAQLPLDHTKLRSVLTAAEAGKLYEGYFNQTPNGTQVAATRNYGIGLGLSHPDQPQRFAPLPECRAIKLIAELLVERKGSELPVYKIYERLSGGQYGLPFVVIQLYLWAFVRHNDPRTELTLKRDHKLRTRDGKAFPRERVNAATVTELAWRPGIEKSFDALLPVAGPSWNDTLTYAKELVAELHVTSDQGDIESQNTRLQQRLDELTSDLTASHETMATLERALRGALPEKDQRAYSQLHELAAGGRDGYAMFYERAQELYGSADNLRDAMRAFNRLKELVSVAAQINEVKLYLDAVRLKPNQRELQADRDALLAQLNLELLASQPNLWPALKASFESFKGRYRNEYIKFHRDANTDLHELRDDLAAAERRLNALTLLNGIEDLGAPRGLGLESQYQTLLQKVKLCGVTDFRSVDVNNAPVCAQCHRPFLDEPPHTEVKTFLRTLESALDEQRLRLSSEAIRRVLAQSNQDTVTQFIQVAQSANLSALIDLLDENVVLLIRSLLAKNGVLTTEVDVLRQFAQQYPALDEGDIDAAVKHFEKLIREAFKQARRDNPDKKSVRLTMK